MYIHIYIHIYLSLSLSIYIYIPNGPPGTFFETLSCAARCCSQFLCHDLSIFCPASGQDLLRGEVPHNRGKISVVEKSR